MVISDATLGIWLSNWWLVWGLALMAAMIVNLVVYAVICLWLQKQRLEKQTLILWLIWGVTPLLLFSSLISFNFDPSWYWLWKWVFFPFSVIHIDEWLVNQWLVFGFYVSWLSLLAMPISFGIKKLSNKWLPTKSPLATFKFVIVATMIGGLVSGTALLSLWILEEALTAIPQEFHIFNAHLKDVCSQEKWQQQCPRTVTDLRNYSPNDFDAMSSHSIIDYYVDDLGHGTLLVRTGNLVQISDGRFPDRFSAYWLDTNETNQKYPPALPGQWDRILLQK